MFSISVCVLLMSVGSRLKGVFTFSALRHHSSPSLFFKCSHLSSFPLFSRPPFGCCVGADLLSGDSAADSKRKTFDLTDICERLCTQILDCWTAQPEACLSSSQPTHNEAWWRGGGGGGKQLRQPCTVQHTALWEVYWVKAHCAPVVCSAARYCTSTVILFYFIYLLHVRFLPFGFRDASVVWILKYAACTFILIPFQFML